jgi:hypothetical protein
MKRVLLTVAVALLIPSILMAAPVTVGVYFDGSLVYTPTGGPSTSFKASLYMIQNDYYVTGVEYARIFRARTSSSRLTPIRPAMHWIWGML